MLLISCNLLLFTSPEPALAHPAVLKWTRINTPGASAEVNDIVSPCEVNRLAVGFDGRTFYAVDIVNPSNVDGSRALYKSTNSGKSWCDAISRHLYQAMTPAEQANFRVWNIAIAPDDANVIAVVTNSSTSNLPRQVWLSENGGAQWQNTDCPVTNNISTIDISSSYSDGNRDIALGTRTGTGNGNVWVMNTATNNWAPQGLVADIMALKFSPNYTNDTSIVIVHSDFSGTYLNAGVHDPDANTTNWNVIYHGNPPEITAGAPGTSPAADQIITADLELPADFSGQALPLRRYYVSIDDAGATGNGGIYRIDNQVVYQLMSATPSKRISSIAYHGTYASGKLLAGEVLGDPCSATVMTWFTDSPTTCPIPCWYPAMKPPTGSAGTDNCTGSGYGNTQVVWSPDGSIAYAATASTAALLAGANWPDPYLSGEDLDESAISISHNNGETWNQLSLIDTRIDQFTDIAPAPDCTTLYLASINSSRDCSGFDSVWRSQSSPLGTYWERVLCMPTTDEHCAAAQTDLAILRLAGNYPSGQVISWAAVGAQNIMWSPDFGDYWLSIANPRFDVQDMAFEDSKTLYALSTTGLVQKFTFGGTGWICHEPVSSHLDSGYSIATAYTELTPDNDRGHIIVGSAGTGIYDVAYSTDGGASFTPITAPLPTRGNTLVIAHSGYKQGGDIFAINSGGMYQWSIYYGGGTWAWPLPEPDKWAVQWGGPSWPTPVTGLSISRQGSFYFSDAWGINVRWASATAGIDPAISFGTDPTRRLRICGGMASGEPITVFLIDQRPYNPPQGGVWCYTDTLSWVGPTPIQPVSQSTVEFDPASGRAGEINLRWKPVSLSRGYRIQIAKDEDFAMEIADIGGDWGGPFYTPPDLDTPALVIPPGGGTVIDSNGNTWTVPALEAGHTYYWRVSVRDVATGDAISSPWSWRESFIVKTGLRVATPYYGPQLLSPDNGCLGCPVNPVSFSWSPFQDTTKYKFILARDATMTDVVVETEVTTTSFDYEGVLDYNASYFWRVKAVEPVPSNWSAIFAFQTQAAPKTAQPSDATQEIPLWGWLIIGTGVILNISLIILILRRQTG